MYYFIKLFKGVISIDECAGNKQNALKNMGERSQKFDYDTFWAWWKKKVEYQGQEVVFVVLTDQKSFAIPQEIKIADAEKTNNIHPQALQGIPADSTVITKPKGILSDRAILKLPKKKASKIQRNDHSLQDYFVKETARLRS